MGKLDNKVAIVTGASRGIGRAIAQLFAAEGARVVCGARTVNEGDHIMEGSINTTVSEIEKAGGTAAAVQVDVSDEESCANLVERTREIFGPVDVLVNDAALTYFIPVKDYPVRRWIRSFSVNFHGPFMLSQKVLPDMIERRSGSIGTCYGAEKAALERFTQGLAEEVYQYGVSVTCVSPSLVVATPGTVYHHLVTGMDDPRAESTDMMAKAALLLATEPLDKISGRVTYSQEILKEFGWITEGKGIGIDRKGSGYSQI